ncbi:MAG: ABC transporter ATP-binding protein [Kiritimatiellae bacterium]|nr:ABC transporter ATP-binding protein [Kiritimatiellia bacterium]
MKTNLSIEWLPLPLDNNPIKIGSGPEARVRVRGVSLSSVAAVVTPVLEGEWVLRHAPDAKDFIAIRGLPPLQPGASISLEEGMVFSVAGVSFEIRGGQLRIPQEDLTGLSVSVRNLSATGQDGKPLLDNVSFDIAPGEFVGLLGPSGCGKSSLLQRMLSLAPKTSGSILFNGRDAGEEPNAVLPLVAYLPQSVERTLHDALTVRQEIDDYCRIHLASDPDRSSLENFLLEKLGLASAQLVGKLSGGEKRRLALLLALLRRPRVLLLDEPTAGLDPGLESTVFQQLRSLAASQGVTVLCATHAAQEARKFDRVLLIDKGGRLVADARWSNILGGESPQELFIRLACGTESAVTTRPGSSVSAADLPSPTPPASFVGTVCGYLARARHMALSLRSRASLGLLRNDVVLPLLAALVVNWTCGEMFLKDRGLLCFCCLLALFWFGLAGSVRSLVSERVPGRCLENLARVSLSAFFTSHLIRMTGHCLIQTLAFLLPLRPFMQEEARLRAATLPEVYVVLFGVALLGGAAGLLVSAWSRKEPTAIATIPFIAILALFFSEPVVGVVEPGDNAGLSDDNGLPKKILVCTIRNFTPCHHARYVLDNRIGIGLEKRRAHDLDQLTTPDEQRAFDDKIERNYGRQLVVSRRGFLRTLSCGMILLLCGAFIGEFVRESQWDGRANGE